MSLSSKANLLAARLPQPSLSSPIRLTLSPPKCSQWRYNGQPRQGAQRAIERIDASKLLTAPSFHAKPINCASRLVESEPSLRLFLIPLGRQNKRTNVNLARWLSSSSPSQQPPDSGQKAGEKEASGEADKRQGAMNQKESSSINQAAGDIEAKLRASELRLGLCLRVAA